MLRSIFPFHKESVDDDRCRCFCSLFGDSLLITGEFFEENVVGRSIIQSDGAL